MQYKSSKSRRPKNKALRVCVAIQDDGLSGIESYAEQVAIASATAGHDTTLIVTTQQVAHAVRDRLAGLPIRVVDTGSKPRTPAVALADRFVPQLHTSRLGDAFERTLKKLGTTFDVIHLNRPGLAPWASGFSARLFVAGWFFPHAAGPRLAETWRHTRGFLPRRALITAKALSYYAGDQRGYRAATSVVTCTELLASQLRSQGIRAVACPPPVRIPHHAPEDYGPPNDGALHLLVCAGDLSHPRKNIRDAIRAAARLATPERPVVLRAVGCNSDTLESKARRVKVADGAHFELRSLGVLSPGDVQREMRRSHALVLPSLYEEWGYVAIESILSGTPVVSYPVYPFADLLAGGLGVVAQERTPDALARAIEKSLSIPRGEPLAAAGETRFGSRALGALLTRIWDVPAAPSQLPLPLPAAEPIAIESTRVAVEARRARADSARPGLARVSDRPRAVASARSDYPAA